jgi:hypothetical protein
MADDDVLAFLEDPLPKRGLPRPSHPAAQDRRIPILFTFSSINMRTA